MDLVHNDDSAYYRIKQYHYKLLTVDMANIWEQYRFEMHAATIMENRTPTTVIDTTVTQRIINTPTNAQRKLFNSATFRDFVMTGYGNLCAITGTVIKYQAFSNLKPPI